MDLKDIIGQPVLVQSLENALKNHMIANAYIFNGPKGCGKKTAARIFAAGINCSSYGYKPCGHCVSCKKVKAYASPDIMHIRPTGNTIKIGQIREIIAKVSVRPFENPHRIIIIEDGDSMTHQAQDAFLKTLEEPEGNNIFIVLTENYNTLLPTIVSRCQVFNFIGVNSKAMRDYFKKNFDFPLEKLEFAIEKSNGIIGRAIEILNTNEFTSEDRFYMMLKKILQGKIESVLSFNEELSVNRDDAIEFLDFLLNWFKDVLLWKETGDEEFISWSTKNKGLIEEYGERIKEEDIFFIIDVMRQVRRAVDYNINIKNSIDGILLRILEVCNDKSSRSAI